MKKSLFFLVLIAIAAGANATTHRSYKAKEEFAAQHPCPATGKAIPHCPGYVIDHVVPLCAGGLDDPINMQWQEHGASLAKDKIERRTCADIRYAAKQGAK